HADCQAKSPVKTLDRLDVERAGEEVQISASARSFLHTQVRSMVGALAFVGEGRWSAGDLSAALAARDRTACAPVAPPEGLYLVRVDYRSRLIAGRPGASAIASRRRTACVSPPLASISRSVGLRKARLGEAASSRCQCSVSSISSARTCVVLSNRKTRRGSGT